MSGDRPDLWSGALAEAVRQERTAMQPGGRATAPGELVLVQSFVNTHFDLVEHWGADVLASPAALAGWFARRGLIGERDRATDADLERAIAVREGLRALARGSPDHSGSRDHDSGSRDHAREADMPIAALDAASAGIALRIAFGAPGPRLEPASLPPIERALGLILSIAYAAMLDGGWQRLKACPGHHCGWVFYDGSRNNSGRWCSMSVCGGRAKARTHYRRRRAGGD